MTFGQVILPIENEIIEDAARNGGHEILDWVMGEGVSTWCRDFGVTRLEGPPRLYRYVPELFIMDRSALIWPAEFPEES